MGRAPRRSWSGTWDGRKSTNSAKEGGRCFALGLDASGLCGAHFAFASHRMARTHSRAYVSSGLWSCLERGHARGWAPSRVAILSPPTGAVCKH